MPKSQEKDCLCLNDFDSFQYLKFASNIISKNLVQETCIVMVFAKQHCIVMVFANGALLRIWFGFFSNLELFAQKVRFRDAQLRVFLPKANIVLRVGKFEHMVIIVYCYGMVKSAQFCAYLQCIFSVVYDSSTSCIFWIAFFQEIWLCLGFTILSNGFA